MEELNQRFWQWLEEDYHRKVHASLGMTPLDKFLSQVGQVRLVSDPGSLDVLFLKRDYRKVKHDGTISVNTRLYEVPPQFIGTRVEVRYDDTDVYIYENGSVVCRAIPVNFADNAKVKRNRSLSFRDMVPGKGEM